jgi:multiple sugar transport system permease protein
MAISALDLRRSPNRARSRWRPSYSSSLLTRRRRRMGLLLTLPALVLIILLIVVPIGQAIYYSMTEWNGVTSTWIGRRCGPGPPQPDHVAGAGEQRALVAVGTLRVGHPPVHRRAPAPEGRRLEDLSVHLLLADGDLVGRHWSGRRAFLRLQRHAELNTRLAGLQKLTHQLLGNESTALIALGITFVFSMIGTNTMLFLTGLATFDPSQEEAARIDGAGAMEDLSTHHAAPSHEVHPAGLRGDHHLAFSALFSLIFVMTGGGPGYSTTTMEFLIYQTGFNRRRSSARPPSTV